MKIILGLSLCLGLASAAFGQTAPKVKYRGNRAISLSGLLNRTPMTTCRKPQIKIGSVDSTEINRGELLITSFVLRTAGGKRFSIRLDDTQINLLGESGISLIASTLRKENKLRIKFSYCNFGGSSSFNFAESIYVMR